jgi:hypothetical protein
MLDYYNDSTIRIDYNPVTNKESFQLTSIGPDAGATISVYSGITPTDSNSIFVNDTTGNDTTGDGTSASPYKTVLKGINSCTATKIYVIIQDSATYAEDLTTVSNIYFTQIYADTAQAPVLQRRVLSFTPADSNSIFVNATTGNDSTGDGSQANPYASITTGAANCDATHQAVVITDSATYTDGGLEFTGNFLGLYAADGCAPTWEPGVNIGFSAFGDTSIKAYTTFPTTAASNFGPQAIGVFSDNSFVVIYELAASPYTYYFIVYNATGSIQVAATSFDTGSAITSQPYFNVTVLSNDDFIISYIDKGDSNKAKFCKYSKAGVQQIGPTVLDSSSCEYTSIDKFSNDDFVVIWNDSTNNEASFEIYNSSGVSQVGPTVFLSFDAEKMDVSVLPNDDFVIIYTDSNDGDKGKFVIYNQSGVLQTGPTIFNNAATNSSGASAALSMTIDNMSNNNFIIVCADTVDDETEFFIYNSAGVLQTGPITVDSYGSGSTYCGRVKVFSDDSFMVYYYSRTDANNYYKLYNSLGVYNGIIAIQEPITTSTIAYNFNILNNDNIVFSISAGFTIKNLTYFLFKVSSSTVLNGININAVNLDYAQIIIYAIDDIDLKNCTLQKCLDTASNDLSYAVYSDSDITAQYCSIHENGAGFYTEEATSDIQDCIFYKNEDGPAIHIKGAAASSGDITIEHCTLFNNYTGIRLESNNGSNEVLKNLIIHDNVNYGIQATTAVTYTYSTNTDTLLNASAGASVLLTNPLFINEGVLDVDDTDLNLRSSLLGYTTSSPAIDLADDSRDAGAYYRVIIGSAVTWTTITLYKPIKGVNVWTEPVKGIKNIRKDGSISTTREALTEYIQLDFLGVSNADYAEILALLQNDDSQVRIYPDPVTSPSAYNTYKYVYGTINGSASHYKLTRTGRGSNTIIFARATT